MGYTFYVGVLTLSSVDQKWYQDLSRSLGSCLKFVPSSSSLLRPNRYLERREAIYIRKKKWVGGKFLSLHSTIEIRDTERDNPPFVDGWTYSKRLRTKEHHPRLHL